MCEKKERRVSIRMTEEQYKTVESKANTAQMSMATYIRAAALRHKVTVVEGLPEITHELKGIGRNINQVVTLAHQDRIKTVYLEDTVTTLAQIYNKLSELADKGRR